MNNNVKFVAKGLMLDNLIDDMLKEIELTGADIELLYGFIDYCVVDFTRGTKMRDLEELETLYINKKIKQRIQKLNRSIQ